LSTSRRRTSGRSVSSSVTSIADSDLCQAQTLFMGVLRGRPPASRGTVHCDDPAATIPRQTGGHGAGLDSQRARTAAAGPIRRPTRPSATLPNALPLRRAAPSGRQATPPGPSAAARGRTPAAGECYLAGPFQCVRWAKCSRHGSPLVTLAEAAGPRG
jgi:hypothetical protein